MKITRETIIPKVREETRRVKIAFELKKDLQENEVICEHCHGTGLEIANNIYGIEGDTAHIGVHFPYKNQSLEYCRFCYNGVQEKCPSCGSLRGKMDRECSCGYTYNKYEQKIKREYDGRWEKAEKIPIEKAWKDFKCLYVENVDRYVFDDGELDDLIEEYELKDIRIYGTEEVGIKLDAADIIESACDCLHENAAERCDAKELQIILDQWCKSQDGATSYYPNHKIGVVKGDDR